jgi:hypothetical protein
MSGKWRPEILLSPLFVGALLVLLVNDHVLKHYYPSWLTGKLSDFAGLFVLCLFLLGFFHPRTRLIPLACAGLFAFWKSPLSESFITAWNTLPLFPVHRVVDYTDLLALAVLPAGAAYARRLRPIVVSKLLAHSVLLVAVLAMAGTSRLPPHYKTDLHLETSTPYPERPEGRFKNEPTHADVNAIIDSIAEKHELFDVSPEGRSHYRLYKGSGMRLQSNYDVSSGQLFVEVYVHLGQKEKDDTALRNGADALRTDLVAALASSFRNAPVMNDRQTFLKTFRATRVSVKTPRSEGRYVACLTEESILVRETAIRHVTSVETDDNTAHGCRNQPQWAVGSCRSYRLGRITGSDRFDRSTTVNLKCESDSYSIDFVEHIEDPTVDIQAMSKGLADELRRTFGEEAVSVTFD